jgi:PKD repeat protein
MVATQVADSIYQSYALYMTLNNVSVVSPMYIIPQDTPIADFAADKTTGPAPLTVNFTDQSVPGTGQEITSWAWEFGDGATSTDPNPTHEYTVPGLYPVSLTVVTPVGENTITKDDYIYVTIGSEGPTAAIYAEPIDGLTIQYDDLSTPGAAAITGWAWSFGDSVGTSTEKTGQYTYGADGTYEVTLTVTDANGLTDTASKFVTVSEVPVEGQPLEGQPLEGQPLEGQPLEGQPLEGQPLEGQPLEGQPLEGQPLEGQPAEGQPAEGQPAEGQPAEGQPAEGQPAEGQPAEGQAPVEGQAGTDGEAPAEGDVPAPSDNGCAGCSGGTISAGGGFGSGGNGGNLMLFALAGVVLALSSRKPEKSQVELS